MFARFVIPNCCLGLIQFFFDVLISVYLLGLLGVDKLVMMSKYVLETCTGY
jgi:hypothetical protein